MTALKFITAGSINDGKSTLLGRLMFDMGKIPADVASKMVNSRDPLAELNLAYLTDGLKKEREDGITVDVSYKYFSHHGRRFILVDAPGHFEYTRNMFTGASNCDVILVLIDARHGMTDQTKLHLRIAGMLRMQRVFVLINKIDLVDYSASVFTQIKKEISDFLKTIANVRLTAILPISALNGDNVIHKSKNTPWYTGKPLFTQLEELDPSKTPGLPRTEVQHAIIKDNEPYYFCHVNNDRLDLDEPLYVYPAGIQIKIKSIYVHGEKVNRSKLNQPVAITIKNKVTLTRGDLLTNKKHSPAIVSNSMAKVCCLGDEGLKTRKHYLLVNGGQKTSVTIGSFHTAEINHELKKERRSFIRVNDIADVQFKFKEPLRIDFCDRNFDTSKFILIDKKTKNTIAAGYFRENLH